MLQSIAAIAALLLAAGILLTGSGLQTTLISVRADLEGFPTALVGLLMSAYFIGFILGCRVIPGVIKSAGHIRTFVAFASIGSASALTHSILVGPATWLVLRAVTGFCFAGLTMVLESWINERATNQNRGRLLSIYRVVDLGAVTLGNALLAIADPGEFYLFALISVLMSLALVPIALTRSVAPPPIASARLNIKKLFEVSPVAAIGAPTLGLANAAFWAVGPVYAQRSGYDAAAIGAFMSAVIIGAALFQWPLGLISDRIDRRLVLLGSSAIGASAAFAMSIYGGVGFSYLIGVGFFVGAFTIPSFGLCAAHANDHAAPGEAVATSGGLLLLHGMGSALGAVLGATVMSAFGPPSLFVYIGGVYAGFSLICFARILARPPVPRENKSPFRPAPKNPAGTGLFRKLRAQSKGAKAEPRAEPATQTP
ncbi:MAG: MFS transporter [Parvularculaceae bacterium]